jgi:hypothetical protein
VLGYGAIAQLGERYNGIVEVSGSIPLSSTILFNLVAVSFFKITIKELAQSKFYVHSNFHSGDFNSVLFCLIQWLGVMI